MASRLAKDKKATRQRKGTQITEWRGGDKSQHWRSPSTSSPELLGPGKGTKCRPNQESAPLTRGEAKDSAVLPSRDADLLEPPSGVNGVKPPLHFGERARDCSPGHAGKEGPSPREDEGVSGVSSSYGARGGFLASGWSTLPTTCPE